MAPRVSGVHDFRSPARLEPLGARRGPTNLSTMSVTSVGNSLFSILSSNVMAWSNARLALGLSSLRAPLITSKNPVERIHPRRLSYPKLDGRAGDDPFGSVARSCTVFTFGFA